MDFRNAPVAKNIIIINVLIWLASEVLSRNGVNLDSMFGLHFYMASKFHWYQFISYQFLHAGFWHVFCNMLAMFWFGPVMERTWGSRKFLFFYIICGIGAGITQEITQAITYYAEELYMYQTVSLGGNAVVSMETYLNMMNTVGASGCVFGVLLAFGMFYPNETMFIFPLPFPIKAKWMVVGYAVFELCTGVSSAGGGDNVAHFAHLGGMLVGWLLILYWRKFGDYSLPFGLEPLINEYCPKEHTLGYKLKNLFGGKKEAKFKTYRNDNYNNSSQQTTQQTKPKRDPEIDAILKKIRESGYESLTAEEKRKLFNGN